MTGAANTPVMRLLADKIGLNTSGMQPVEYKILIAPEVVEEVSSGGIVLATKTTEREKMAQVKGKLVAIGGNAFEDWADPKPQLGDTIWFAKYAGYVVNGADGAEYRLANDKDISAVLIDTASTTE